MPITVTCACGKTFRVRDELAGRQVTCQVCGATVEVGAGPAVPQAAARVAAPVPPPLETVRCPACAETISRQARVCPACGETVRTTLTPAEQQELLKAVEAALASHRPALDALLRGRFPSIKTWVAGVLTFLSLALFGYGMLATDGEVATVFGVIFGVIFGISLIVTFVNDHRAHHIQDADSAEVAFKRFFGALKTGRIGPAFASLVPAARTARRAESIKFNNPNVPHQPAALDFSDPSGYAAYWKQIFKGPGSHNRTVNLKKVRIVSRRADGVSIVEATLGVTSYHSGLLLLILVNIIVCAIVIQIVQKKDEVVLRKALIRRRDRWYLLEGVCQGELDLALR